ncbi:serine/threonine-protein kinase [Mariniblastus fucicola]|uniref:serine/threonine-protein kinase n=1 Tax=Mariniblastus fucicola TaxID=980251 RepID=UPI001EE3C7CC|nr:serine/threonine-protein kinase [Mariniblastus fucicola]
MPEQKTRAFDALPRSKPNLKARQSVGKYRLQKLIGVGGFARVYAALDTIEGSQVALKIPHEHYVDDELMEAFRQEVRLLARLDHPNILTLKDASIIDDRLVIATRLGKETLQDRLMRRMSVPTALGFAEQMIAGVAHAHEAGLIHCDIKPENFIVFEGDQLRLADFGIAKVATMTISGSGTGTVGHMSTEQAMGKPSMRSDVFSLGLIIFRMLSGKWPEYPFEWPAPGTNNLRRKHVHPDLIAFIRKSISPKPRDRFSDAIRMEEQFGPLHAKALRHLKKARR